MTAQALEEEWFTLDSIEMIEAKEQLYCIAVDSEDKQFLAGHTGIPTHNTEEGKAEDALKGEASMIIGSIARLGRAAGVHLVIATQRPDATIIPGETKANLGVRINCGRSDSNASNMILGNGEGMRIRANPRGRLYVRIYGNGDHGQGFFADTNWIDEYLAEQGLNPDGSPITKPRSQLANVTDFSQFEDGDLDSREGVDNEAIIQRIREEEATRAGFDEEDWGFTDDEPASSAQEEDDSLDAASPDRDRPMLTNGAGAEDRFHRPEEDWDLDDIIEENFN